MKLIITTPIFPPEIGGPASYTAELVKRLNSEDDLMLFTFTPHPQPVTGAKIISLPQFPLPILGSLLRQKYFLFKLLFHARTADAIYSQGPLVVGFVSTIVGKLLNLPVTLKFVGDIPWETAQTHKDTRHRLDDFYRHQLPLKYQLLAAIQRISLKLAARIITPSGYLKSFLTKHHRIDPKKITTLANPVEVTTVKLPKKKHQLIFVGRLQPWKHVDDIIHAVRIARKKHPWQLVIVGDGPEKNRLQQLARQLQAGDWVTFSGKLSQAATHRLIARSQRLILYSSYEGQPHTLIESLLLGAPVIASDIPPHRELLGSHQPLVPLGSPQKLAGQINLHHPPDPTFIRQLRARHLWQTHLEILSQLLHHS